MKRIIALCGVMVLAACTTLQAPQPLSTVKSTLDARFTYVSNREKYGEDFVWHPGETGERTFTGNCVNYAEAAIYQLKKIGVQAREWFVKTETGEFHMVACANGWCIDNRRPQPFALYDYRYHWIADATPEDQQTLLAYARTGEGALRIGN